MHGCVWFEYLECTGRVSFTYCLCIYFFRVFTQAGRRQGVFLLPQESAQAVSHARRDAARSKFDISHRTFQQFPYTSAAIPNNGSVYDVGGGVFEASWPAEQSVGHVYRSGKELVHSNAAMLVRV